MVRLSPRHGLNPAIPICFYCHKEKNMLLIPGMLPGDVEAPRNSVWDMEPCDECKGYMEQGIIIISVKNGEDEKMERERQEFMRNHPPTRGNKQRGARFVPNPYRTGGWWVVTDDAIKRWVTNEKLQASILRARFVFMPDEVVELIGLTKG